MAWRYVGQRAFGTASMASLMDELFTLGTSSTYADGSARSPGSGSAGTWSRVQISSVTECLNVSPPVNALNSRIMIGGATYTPTPSPTMHSPESYATSNLMVNLVKNAGAFTTWNSATPFTTGQVFGWGKFWSTSNGQGNVFLWEGKEAIAVLATNAAGGSACGFIAGAILDPETSDTTVDSESDNRVYGVIRTGPSATLSTTFLNGGTGNFLFTANANNSNYAGIFSPGQASLLQMNPTTQLSSNPSATTLKSRSGTFVRLAISMRGSTLDNFFGRLREVYAYSDAQLPARQSDGANTIGHVFCGSSVSQVDSLLLEYA